eukprot:2003990-Rhodomonas_salina.2
MLLRACYAMCGTELAYDATQTTKGDYQFKTALCVAEVLLFRACTVRYCFGQCALRGTVLGHCAVLIWAMCTARGMCGTDMREAASTDVAYILLHVRCDIRYRPCVRCYQDVINSIFILEYLLRWYSSSHQEKGALHLISRRRTYGCVVPTKAYDATQRYALSGTARARGAISLRTARYCVRCLCLCDTQYEIPRMVLCGAW